MAFGANIVNYQRIWTQKACKYMPLLLYKVTYTHRVGLKINTRSPAQDLSICHLHVRMSCVGIIHKVIILPIIFATLEPADVIFVYLMGEITDTRWLSVNLLSAMWGPNTVHHPGPCLMYPKHLKHFLYCLQNSSLPCVALIYKNNVIRCPLDIVCNLISSPSLGLSCFICFPKIQDTLSTQVVM